MWQTKFGTCIYTSPSGYKVHQNFLYRWLTLGSNALQTVLNKYKPQEPVLYYLPALTFLACKKPGSVCLLGLGGAGVAHMLASSGHSIIAVDSDDEVLSIAQQFFMLDQIPQLSLVHKNARDYVRDSTTLFDHLIIDLYDANNFPSECMHDDFFINCKNILKVEGFAAFNLANLKDHSPVYKLIKKQFINTLVIPVKKSANMVVIASNNPNKDSFIKEIKQYREIRRLLWVDSWGCVAEYKK